MATTNVQVHARTQHIPPTHALSILLLASMVLIGSAEPPPTYRFDLIHVDANGNFTREELIHRAANRTVLFAATPSATDDTDASSIDFSATAQYSQHEYLMELKIGTPPKPFHAVADTGSDVTWMKCCNQESSSSFTPMTCSQSGGIGYSECSAEHQCMCIFHKSYGTGTRTVNGFMGSDVLTFLDGRRTGPTPIGCVGIIGVKLPGKADGIVGLSRSPKSLLTELGVKKFSYCLSSSPERKSKFWLGGDGLASTAGGASGATVPTTPLVTFDKLKPTINEKSVRAYRYYIELRCISVGKHDKKLNEEHKKEDLKHMVSETGNRIMFVDSGCSYTILESDIFDELMTLLNSNGLKNPVPYKNLATCFPGVADQIRPEMVLHFTDRAKMSLPWTSYMLDMNDSWFCLAMKRFEKRKGPSVLGNFQQQNIRMFYDLDGKNELSFVRVDDCSKL